MPTNDEWQLPLPDYNPEAAAAQPGFADEVDEVLLNAVDRINGKYSSHGIEAAPTKTTRTEPDYTVVLNYALYLSFKTANYFSYRLFELVSKQPNGGFPVQGQAFSGPPEPFEANTPAELNQKIAEILDSPRARLLINTYYKP
jgi:hypothetical protein